MGFKVKVSIEELPSDPNKGLEPMPCTSDAQYLNVCQRKLGTIIIQTVHFLQHDSAVTGSLPDGKFLNGQPIVVLIK